MKDKELMYRRKNLQKYWRIAEFPPGKLVVRKATKEEIENQLRKEANLSYEEAVSQFTDPLVAQFVDFYKEGLKFKIPPDDPENTEIVEQLGRLRLLATFIVQHDNSLSKLSEYAIPGKSKWSRFVAKSLKYRWE